LTSTTFEIPGHHAVKSLGIVRGLTVRTRSFPVSFIGALRTLFGGRVEILFKDGSRLVDELGVANAHPNGAKPFGRADYIRKFKTITDGIISARESNRFLEVVQDLTKLKAGELSALNVALPAGGLLDSKPGIF
jgi:2-methylcitrate dehydratase PrpD